MHKGRLFVYLKGMNERNPDDFAHERQALDAAHAQNEAGRDAFVALGHTALFAASVSFVGDVAPLTEAIWKPMLLAGWSADVIGLLALTLSFGAARRSIDARRAALNDSEAPTSGGLELLNGIALWCFPVALLCLFSFVTANVVHADDRKQDSTAVPQRGIRSSAASKVSELRAEGSSAASASTHALGAAKALDWSRASTACTGSTPAPTPCSAAGKEMRRAGRL